MIGRDLVAITLPDDVKVKQFRYRPGVVQGVPES